jgi:hypothetical protein
VWRDLRADIASLFDGCRAPGLADAEARLERLGRLAAARASRQAERRAERLRLDPAYAARRRAVVAASKARAEGRDPGAYRPRGGPVPAPAERRRAHAAWGPGRPACAGCGGTARAHKARGLCTACYAPAETFGGPEAYRAAERARICSVRARARAPLTTQLRRDPP